MANYDCEFLRKALNKDLDNYIVLYRGTTSNALFDKQGLECALALKLASLRHSPSFALLDPDESGQMRLKEGVLERMGYCSLRYSGKMSAVKLSDIDMLSLLHLNWILLSKLRIRYWVFRHKELS